MSSTPSPQPASDAAPKPEAPDASPRGRVRCVINGKEIFVWPGYRLWDAALDADARLWQACGGHGQCTTCAVLPLEGLSNLTDPTPLERFSMRIWFFKPIAAVRKRWKGKPVRLACQAYVRGPVECVGLFGKTAKKAREAKGLE
jgi:ferredoxin